VWTMRDLTNFVKIHFDEVESQALAWVTSLLYLTDQIGANEWQSRLKPYLNSRCSAKDARMKLVKNGYFFQVKMLLLDSIHRGVPLSKNLVWKVSDRDATRLKLDLASDNFVKLVKKRLKSVPKSMDLGWSRPFALAYPEVLKYIKYISYNKLRFIAKANNTNVSDLYPELAAAALKSFYQLWPTVGTPLYIANYIKRSVHNRAINFIKSETTLKRGRIVKTGTDRNGENQFSLLEIGENKLNLAASEDGSILNIEDLQNESDRSELQFKFELELSVKTLLEKYKEFPKKYTFLFCLLGNEDEGFSTWLKFRGYSDSEDSNADLQDRIGPDLYTTYLCRYLHVSTRSGFKFLTQLSSTLGYDKKGVNDDRYLKIA
jgi:hypothetical protein